MARKVPLSTICFANQWQTLQPPHQIASGAGELQVMASGLPRLHVATSCPHMCTMQVQQLDIRSGVKLDLLEALTQVPHTGVYGLQVCHSEVSSFHLHTHDVRVGWHPA